MNGTIVLPDLLVNYRYHDYNWEMAKIFEAATGYQIIPYKQYSPSILNDLDVLISVQLPSYFCQSLHNQFPLLGAIPKHVRFVYWVDEIHWDSDIVRSEMARYMERADVLIVTQKSLFAHWYPEYAPKAIFLPLFAHNRFTFPDLNSVCKLQCLAFAGAPQSWHPLRYKMEIEGPHRLGNRLNLVTHAHVSPGPIYLFDAYAKLLRQHECTFTSGCNSTTGLTQTFTGKNRSTITQLKSRYPQINWDQPVGHLHLKQFEIPCTGSLLICDNRPAELSEIGFIPGENFVDCTAENMFDVVTDCVDHPDNYLTIRKAGMRLVQQKHLKKNRIAEVEEILKSHGIEPNRTKLLL